MSQQRTDKIKLSDGRQGTQTLCRDAPGDDWELTGILITKTPYGDPCRHVYARKSFLDAKVYDFGHLGNVTWDLVETGPILDVCDRF